jgi:hypothetical protein
MGHPDASASLKEKDWERVDMDTKIVLDNVPQVDDSSIQFRLYKRRFVGCIAMVTKTNSKLCRANVYPCFSAFLMVSVG